MKRQKLTIYISLIILSLLSVLFPVVRNWSSFNEKFNARAYEQKYNKSQYVIPRSKNPVSDSDLYIHAGYKYATGLSPVLINSDHPPLGKYIIGFSIVLFNNFNYISLITGFGVMTLLYLTIFKLTDSHLLSAVGIFMLSLDTMFKDQIITGPYLDLYQAFFLMAYFYCFVFWNKKRDDLVSLIILGVLLGCLAATKFYFPAVILLGVTGLYLLMVKEKLFNVIKYIGVIFICAVITYTATYAAYFLQGNSIRSFLGAQKWIFLYWKDNSVRQANVFGSIVPFVLFNQWRVWWGDKKYIQFEHWSIFWPIFFLTGAYSTYVIISRYIRQVIKKAKLPQEHHKLLNQGLFISLWILTVFLYLCIVPISPRYLMLLYFPMYIMTPLVVKLLFSKYV